MMCGSCSALVVNNSIQCSALCSIKTTLHPCQPKPWYSPILHKIAKLRDRLFRQSRDLPASSPIVTAYKQTRNWYLYELHHAEYFFFKSVHSKLKDRPVTRSSTQWWSCMKSAAGWTAHNQIPPLTANDAIFVSAKDRADVMNFAFSRQCSAPAMTSFPSLPAPSTTLNFMPVTEESVERELRSLDVHKASGLDGLSPSHQVLRECASELAATTCHIFNLSLSTGVFPPQWKVARIRPVFKNRGDRCEPSNYRPIALLCSISKVLEKFIHQQLLSFCLENDVIPDRQYGFL